MPRLVFIFLVFLLFSCSDKRRTNNLVEEALDNPQLINEAYQRFMAGKVRIENVLGDTLEDGIASGYVVYLNPIDDTTKLSKRDERYVRLYLNIYDFNPNENAMKKIVTDTFISHTKNLKEEVKIYYHIENEMLTGTKHFKYEIVDYFYLRSYADSSYIRILESNYEFDTTVYFE